jgi:enoyl-CoA hydratase
MDFKNIKTRIEEQIGFVQIDRAADKNSLNIETSKEILHALINFDQDNSIKCIAIEGNEKLFSPGADIKELQNLTKNKAAEQKLFDSFDEIYNIKKPVVALVEGYALGGGMELALICDFIIASENAKFSQPEVNLGLIPGIGGTQRLKRTAGKYNANYLCMTGEMITAQQAENMGIVSVVLKAGEFKEGAMKILKSISEKPLSSLIEIKRLINKDASLKDERQTFYKLLDGENKYIGIKSFFEKTKPEWK